MSALIALGILLWAFPLYGREISDAIDTTKRRHWYCPQFATLQFAGNLGFLSTGVGYSPFTGHTQFSILYGYAPAFLSKKDIHLITAKATITLFRFPLRRYTVVPYAGMALTAEVGGNSFIRIPSRYPNDYYHSNAFHLSGLVGIRSVLSKGNRARFPRDLEAYCELGTQDIFLYYKLTQREVSMDRVLSAAVGVTLHL